MASELTNTLMAACRADPQAEQQLQSWKTQNFAEFAHALAVEIGAPNRPPEVRQMAALYLKNMLYAKSKHLVKEQQARWKALPKTQRQPIKEALLQSMASDEPQAAHAAAIAASEVAAVELPYEEWPVFVPTLMERVTSTTTTTSSTSSTSSSSPVVPDSVKLASLECLGYTAERIADLEDMLMDDSDAGAAPPELNTATVDKMLTTIVDGVQPLRSDAMRLAALQALRNSLIFVRKNMTIKSERDFIMNAICEATRCSNEPRVRLLAYNCMDQIAEYYYDVLQDYMTALFQLTTEAIKNDNDEGVKMAAVEFWSTIAIQEQNLLDDEKDLQEAGIPLDRQPCPKYVQTAMETLVPLLLDTLTKQEEDVDDDIWNLQAAGAVCLESISNTVESLIVPIVMPFVEQNITNENWRLRDAAIVAFASILDGPATNVIGQFVSQAIPVLLGAFTDNHVVVRDSATHCVSKICLLHIDAVPPDMVHSIIQGLITKLSETPKVASHACYGIFNIAQSLKSPSGDIPETSILSAPMLPLLQALLNATDREDAVESNLRVSAMSAAAELINAAGRDSQPIFRDFLPVVITRIDAALKIEVVSNDDQENKEQLLGLLCALITVLFQRLEKSDIMMHVDQVMGLLLQVLQVRNATCHEEAFLAIGTIAGAIEEDFTKYLQAFMPLLLNGLRSVQAQSLCQVAVGVVVDLCTAVGSRIQPFCDEIMAALRECLQDVNASMEIKPVVISCFGDVAMAIGSAYEPYLQVSVMMLMQAAQQSAAPDNEDMIAFLNILRLSILEAYSGIIMGLADGNALHLIVSNIPPILQFLQFLSTPESNRDDEVLQKAVALVGDIAQQMGNQQQVRQQINQPFVAQLIDAAGKLDDPGARDIAIWTRGVVQQAVQAS